MAAALYLGDRADFEAAATVFHGYLGDRSIYAGFDYGNLCWQADPAAPVGINPVGAVVEGVNVDGVLPDDQRRSELCPPDITCENYVWTALQGVVAQAWMLSRHGEPDVWGWEDQAILRAFEWLHDEADCPAVGDDEWQPHVINAVYATSFPAPVPARHGKNVGWTDWTHATCTGDLDSDGDVDALDFLILMIAWGSDPDGPPEAARRYRCARGRRSPSLTSYGHTLTHALGVAVSHLRGPRLLPHQAQDHPGAGAQPGTQAAALVDRKSFVGLYHRLE
jgi:hypothetical protein